jgi:phosphoribosyl 1,2-cyclic phosphate phosphodiesterase
LEIVFLGTGTSQGVPVITCQCDVCVSNNPKDKRLRSSVLLRIGGKNIAIDAGPDFRQQMLREDVQVLDAILLTHEHKDHVGGLDDIRAYNYRLKRPMEIYGEKRTLDIIKSSEFSYVFAKNKYPGIPEMNLKYIDENPFKIGDIEIIPVRGLHHRLPVLGFRIENFTYITDMNFIPVEEKNKMKDSEILVINALRKESHISHFTLEQALEIIQEIKPKQAFLTHISHSMGLHDEIEKELPHNVHLAHDGLRLKI